MGEVDSRHVARALFLENEKSLLNDSREDRPSGDGGAPVGVHPDDERAWEALYPEMIRLARAERRRWDGNWTLETRALANEAYAKLFKGADVHFNDRRHFHRLVARAIRQILVDYSLSRRAQKRGGGKDVTLVDSVPAGSHTDIASDVIGLTEALDRFRAVDPRGAEIVELKFFAGMKNEEVAELLDVSLATVGRDWRAARAWLKRELADGDNG